MALITGEAVHIVECIPVQVKVRHTTECYSELPVWQGNHTTGTPPGRAPNVAIFSTIVVGHERNIYPKRPRRTTGPRHVPGRKICSLEHIGQRSDRKNNRPWNSKHPGNDGRKHR
ncbi:uncharacterized protein LOC117242205 [Bombus vosnesenskii]|uniref:Uncharacterized protein LOC117242205 n=1 Tax=Bombus vosnesenskii TaxID=207650 RepID=A0A6J3LGS5_9HYME|nr:uncharacterized protein LOC117242205 [Bombus vosnesenskii]